MWNRGLAVVVCLGIGVVAVPSFAQAPAAQFPAEPPTAAPGPTSATTPAPAVTPLTPAAMPPPAPAVVAAAPPAAPAALQPDRAALEPRPEPSWSIGAGISTGEGLGGIRPSYLGALERRLGRASWLLFNVLGSYRVTDQPRSPSSSEQGASYRVITTGSSVSALLGLRYVFVHDVVDVSGTVAFLAGYGKTDSSLSGLQSIGSPLPGADEYFNYGVQAGISAERALIDRLALRLSLRLVGFSVANGTTEQQDSSGALAEKDTSNKSFELPFAPSLALYFYF